MQYSASLDTLALLITIGFFITFCAIAYWNIKSIRSKTNDKITKIIHLLVLIVLIVPLVYTYMYHPKKYVLGNFDFYIKRPVADIVIHVKDIHEIRNLVDSEMNGAIRTFGVGGLFGYFGNYHSPKLGDFKMYATRKKKLVIIYTRQGDTFVVSPDDPGFVDRITMKMNDL